MSPATPYSTTGVYLITHIASGKVYVGSTAQSFRRRWEDHRSSLRAGKHGNRHLQRAWNKHGEQAFSFTIIEVVSDPDLILVREQAWIDHYLALGTNHCYNIAPTAGTQRGLRHTAEARARMSETRRGPEGQRRNTPPHGGDSIEAPTAIGGDPPESSSDTHRQKTPKHAT